jgi:hypothetical protein
MQCVPSGLIRGGRSCDTSSRPPGGALAFRPLPPPTRADVAEVAGHPLFASSASFARAAEVWDPEMQGNGPHPLSVNGPGLAACYAAAASAISTTGERAGKPTKRLSGKKEKPRAESGRARIAHKDGPTARPGLRLPAGLNASVELHRCVIVEPCVPEGVSLIGSSSSTAPLAVGSSETTRRSVGLPAEAQ